MVKWLKRISITLLAIVLLLVAGIVALPLLIDPNDLKPTLQKLAAEQGVRLDLGGPIAWQFYPQLGLSLSDIELTGNTDRDTASLAKLQQGTVSVELLPLFSRQVRVHQILIDGADIQLEIDKNGRGNWETLGNRTENSTDADLASTNASPSAENNSPTEAADTNQQFVLAIDSLSLKNSRVTYVNHNTQTQQQIQQLELLLSEFNLEDRTFPLELSFVFNSDALPTDVHAQWKGKGQIDLQQGHFALLDSNVNVYPIDNKKTRLQLSLSADGSFSGSSRADNTDTQTLSATGNLHIKPVDVSAWMQQLDIELPVMQKNDALTRFEIKSQWSLQQQAGTQDITLSELTINIDDININGSAQATLSPDQLPILHTGLAINAVNVDHYLPPSDTAAASSEASANPEPVSDTPLPLELLRNFNLTADISLQQLIVNNLEASTLRLRGAADQGQWEISEISGEFYDGKLSAAATLDARKNNAVLKSNATLTGLNIQPLLIAQAEFEDLQGIVDAQLSASSTAATVNQFIDNLNANVTFTSQQLLFDSFNAEQSYCEMVTFLQQEETSQQDSNAAIKTWPRRTNIDNVSGEFALANSTLNVKAIQAQLANLRVKATGQADTKQQHYLLRLPMTLTAPMTSENGCRTESNFLLNREVDVLRCQGSYAALAPGEQCGLDRGALRDLAKTALRYNADKKIDSKKEELRESVKNKLLEKLGADEDNNGNDKDEKPSTRELLRNILKRD